MSIFSRKKPDKQAGGALCSARTRWGLIAIVEHVDGLALCMGTSIILTITNEGRIARARYVGSHLGLDLDENGRVRTEDTTDDGPQN